jgi:L-fucose mutarotase/ribose pyranase (RbsD/FucU family)
MKSTKYFVLFAILICIITSCNPKASESKTTKTMEWKIALQSRLSEFGHRNWILIVDKAFPAQNADGIVIIDTGENLLNVLSYTLQQIDSSSHIKPIVYTDKELQFITKGQVAIIDTYRSSLSELIEKFDSQVLLHDSIFVKMDNASKLFKVLVLKINEKIPYSSVFIQLDCKYWSAEKEESLRQKMQK